MQRDIKWIDGLRGIASTVVVSGHLCRSFAPHLIDPAPSETQPPLFFQYPFVRLIAVGRPSVAIFFILTGYVNSIKSITLAREGRTDAALSCLARNSFRRVGRFVLPAMMATIMSWALCQLGAYTIGSRADSAWIRDTSPAPSPTWTAAISSLYENLLATWISGANEYDRIQWTLVYLLRGSFIVYLTLLATVYVKSRYRLIILLGLYAFSWKSSEALVGMNIFAGILMAELNLDSLTPACASNHIVLRNIVNPSLVVLGLFLCGFPETNAEWSNWSNTLLQFGSSICPWGAELNRYYCSWGATLLMVSIMCSTTIQKFLSHPFLYRLGKVSWPVYLIHAILIRTVLSWLVFGLLAPATETDESPEILPRANNIQFAFALAAYFCILYWLADLWLVHIESRCARATRLLEDWVFMEEKKMVAKALP